MKDERFSRIRQLIGDRVFERLQSSSVLVIGLGAVGSYTVEALARSGIGHLTLVDFDQVNPTNINRQLFALESTVGQFKHSVAAARVKDINPSCEVESFRLFVDHNTVKPLLSHQRWSYVMDAIDAVGPKVELLAALQESRLPFLSSMGAACRTDPTRISVGTLTEVVNCPLASIVRKRLRQRNISTDLACVYSSEPVSKLKRVMKEEPLPMVHPADIPADVADSEIGQYLNTDVHDTDRFILPQENLPERELPVDQMLKDQSLQGTYINGEYVRGRTRRSLGSLPSLTGIFGLTAANEIILRLAGLK